MSAHAQVAALGAALGVAGVQHRDLVPHNVLLGGSGAEGEGQLRLVDFGRARTIANGARGKVQKQHQAGQLEQLAARLCSPARLRQYLASQLRPPDPKPNWTQRARERRERDK